MHFSTKKGAGERGFRRLRPGQRHLPAQISGTGAHAASSAASSAARLPEDAAAAEPTTHIFAAGAAAESAAECGRAAAPFSPADAFKASKPLVGAAATSLRALAGGGAGDATTSAARSLKSSKTKVANAASVKRRAYDWGKRSLSPSSAVCIELSSDTDDDSSVSTKDAGSQEKGNGGQAAASPDASLRQARSLFPAYAPPADAGDAAAADAATPAVAVAAGRCWVQYGAERRTAADRGSRGAAAAPDATDEGSAEPEDTWRRSAPQEQHDTAAEGFPDSPRQEPSDDGASRPQTTPSDFLTGSTAAGQLSSIPCCVSSTRSYSIHHHSNRPSTKGSSGSSSSSSAFPSGTTGTHSGNSIPSSSTYTKGTADVGDTGRSESSRSAWLTVGKSFDASLLLPSAATVGGAASFTIAGGTSGGLWCGTQLWQNATALGVQPAAAHAAVVAAARRPPAATAFPSFVALPHTGRWPRGLLGEIAAESHQEQVLLKDDEDGLLHMKMLLEADEAKVKRRKVDDVLTHEGSQGISRTETAPAGAATTGGSSGSPISPEVVDVELEKFVCPDHSRRRSRSSESRRSSRSSSEGLSMLSKSVKTTGGFSGKGGPWSDSGSAAAEKTQEERTARPSYAGLRKTGNIERAAAHSGFRLLPFALQRTGWHGRGKEAPVEHREKFAFQSSSKSLLRQQHLAPPQSRREAALPFERLPYVVLPSMSTEDMRLPAAAADWLSLSYTMSPPSPRLSSTPQFFKRPQSLHHLQLHRGAGSGLASDSNTDVLAGHAGAARATRGLLMQLQTLTGLPATCELVPFSRRCMSAAALHVPPWLMLRRRTLPNSIATPRKRRSHACHSDDTSSTSTSAGGNSSDSRLFDVGPREASLAAEGASGEPAGFTSDALAVQVIFDTEGDETADLVPPRANRALRKKTKEAEGHGKGSNAHATGTSAVPAAVVESPGENNGIILFKDTEAASAVKDVATDTDVLTEQVQRLQQRLRADSRRHPTVPAGWLRLVIFQPTLLLLTGNASLKQQQQKQLALLDTACTFCASAVPLQLLRLMLRDSQSNHGETLSCWRSSLSLLTRRALLADQTPRHQQPQPTATNDSSNTGGYSISVGEGRGPLQRPAVLSNGLACVQRSAALARVWTEFFFYAVENSLLGFDMGMLRDFAADILRLLRHLVNPQRQHEMDLRERQHSGLVPQHQQDFLCTYVGLDLLFNAVLPCQVLAGHVSFAAAAVQALLQLQLYTAVPADDGDDARIEQLEAIWQPTGRGTRFGELYAQYLFAAQSHLQSSSTISDCRSAAAEAAAQKGRNIAVRICEAVDESVRGQRRRYQQQHRHLSLLFLQVDDLGQQQRERSQQQQVEGRVIHHTHFQEEQQGRPNLQALQHRRGTQQPQGEGAGLPQQCLDPQTRQLHQNAVTVFVGKERDISAILKVGAGSSRQDEKKAREDATEAKQRLTTAPAEATVQAATKSATAAEAAVDPSGAAGAGAAAARLLLKSRAAFQLFLAAEEAADALSWQSHPGGAAAQEEIIIGGLTHPGYSPAGRGAVARQQPSDPVLGSPWPFAVSRSLADAEALQWHDIKRLISSCGFAAVRNSSSNGASCRESGHHKGDSSANDTSGISREILLAALDWLGSGSVHRLCSNDPRAVCVADAAVDERLLLSVHAALLRSTGAQQQRKSRRLADTKACVGWLQVEQQVLGNRGKCQPVAAEKGQHELCAATAAAALCAAGSSAAGLAREAMAETIRAATESAADDETAQSGWGAENRIAATAALADRLPGGCGAGETGSAGAPVTPEAKPKKASRRDKDDGNTGGGVATGGSCSSLFASWWPAASMETDPASVPFTAAVLSHWQALQRRLTEDVQRQTSQKQQQVNAPRHHLAAQGEEEEREKQQQQQREQLEEKLESQQGQHHLQQPLLKACAASRVQLIALVAAQALLSFPGDQLLLYCLMVASRNNAVVKAILREYEGSPALWLAYASSLVQQALTLFHKQRQRPSKKVVLLLQTARKVLYTCCSASADVFAVASAAAYLEIVVQPVEHACSVAADALPRTLNRSESNCCCRRSSAPPSNALRNAHYSAGACELAARSLRDSEEKNGGQRNYSSGGNGAVSECRNSSGCRTQPCSRCSGVSPPGTTNEERSSNTHDYFNENVESGCLSEWWRGVVRAAQWHPSSTALTLQEALAQLDVQVAPFDRPLHSLCWLSPFLAMPQQPPGRQPQQQTSGWQQQPLLPWEGCGVPWRTVAIACGAAEGDFTLLLKENGQLQTLQQSSGKQMEAASATQQSLPQCLHATNQCRGGQRGRETRGWPKSLTADRISAAKNALLEKLKNGLPPDDGQLLQKSELTEADDPDVSYSFPLFTSSRHSCCFLLAVLEAATAKLCSSRISCRMPVAAAAAWSCFASLALSQPRLVSGRSGGESRSGEKSSSIFETGSDSRDSSEVLPSFMDTLLTSSVTEAVRGPRTPAVLLGKTASPPQASPAVAPAGRGPAAGAAHNARSVELPLLADVTPAKITGVTGRSFPSGEAGRCLELSFTFLFSLLLCCLQESFPLRSSAPAAVRAFSAVSASRGDRHFFRRTADALGHATASSRGGEDSVTTACTSGEAAALDLAASRIPTLSSGGEEPSAWHNSSSGCGPRAAPRTAAIQEGTAPFEKERATADAATALHDACETALRLFPRNPFFLALHLRPPSPTAAPHHSSLLCLQQLLRFRGDFTARHRAIHFLGHQAWGLRRSRWPQQRRLRSREFPAPTALPERFRIPSASINTFSLPHGDQSDCAVSGTPNKSPLCRQERSCSTARLRPAETPPPRPHGLSLIAPAANAFADAHASVSLNAAVVPAEASSTIAAEGVFSIAALEACVLLEIFTGTPSYKHISRLMETALQSTRLSLYYEGWPAFTLAETATGVEAATNAAAATGASEATSTLQHTFAVGASYERAPLHDYGVAGCHGLCRETAVTAGNSRVRSKAKETIFNLHAHVFLLRLRAAAAAEECFAPSCGGAPATAGESVGSAGRSRGAGDQQRRDDSSICVDGVPRGKRRMLRSSSRSSVCCSWTRVQENVREALQAAAWTRRREAQREADRVLVRGITQFPYSKRLWLLRLQHLLLQRDFRRKRSTPREIRPSRAARASLPPGATEAPSNSNSNTAGQAREPKGAAAVEKEPALSQRSEGNTSSVTVPSNLKDATHSTNNVSRATSSAGSCISKGSSRTEDKAEPAEGELEQPVTCISPADEQLLNCVEAMWERGIHLHFDPVVTFI